jgi:hypothetical protein
LIFNVFFIHFTNSETNLKKNDDFGRKFDMKVLSLSHPRRAGFPLLGRAVTPALRAQ